MTVNYVHPDYNKTLKKWELVRCIVANEAQCYIRTVDKDDPKRSEQYKEDALLVNYTKQTAIGMTGLIFRKETEIIVPEELEYLKEDCTGYDFGLEQLAQQCVIEDLKTGRYGLLVDMPTEGGDVRFMPYAAEAIINWRYEQINGKYKLCLLVLKEQEEIIEDDGFESRFVDRYRALRLVNENYYQQVYNEDYELVESFVPVDYNGNPFDTIPFACIGSENNDLNIDSIPLYDIALVNLSMYKNSADTEETSFVSGQLMPVVNVGENSSAEDFKLANPDGIVVGSRSGVITAGGDFKFAQGQPNILPRELQNDKKVLLASLGAKMIEPAGTGRETAAGARIREGSQTASLYQVAKNVGRAFELALYYAAMFQMPNPSESIFELNDQYYEDTVDPAFVTQQIMLLDREALTAEEIRDYLRSSGMKLANVAVQPINPMMGVADNVTE